MRRFSSTKLKTARLAAGISQRQLAYRLNIASQSVGSWELGHTRPAEHRLPQIAEILGVEIKDLFEEVPNEVQD